MNSKMKAIILVAGINSRLKETIDIPKCLLKIGETTILERQINNLKKSGLRHEDIFVVSGYKHEMIKEVHNNFIFNENFVKFDNAYSVHLALTKLLNQNILVNNEEVIIFDGDLVNDEKLILEIVNNKNKNLLITKKIQYSTLLKDEIIIPDQNGKVIQLTIPSFNNPLDQSYINANLFTYIGIIKLSKDVAEKLNESLSEQHKGWYTLPLPKLVKNYEFHHFPIDDNIKFCFDVDTKEDYDHLQMISAQFNKNTKRYKMFTAGPVNVSDSVKQAMFYPEIGHRESEFSDLFLDIQKKLIKVYGANEKNYTTYVVGGSGTAAMESVISSTVHDNRKMLIISNGAFGERWEEICNIYNIGLNVIKYPWGEKINLQDIENKLMRDASIETVCLVFMETSTGMVNPVKDVGTICKNYGKIFVVDAVSGLCGDPLSVKESNIDFCVSNTNKGLAGLPAISFVCAKNSAIEKIKNIPPRNYYLNLMKHIKYAKNAQTPTTPIIPMFYMLQTTLDEIFKEGVDKRIQRFKDNSSHLRAELLKLGFKFQLNESDMSNVMTNVLLPNNYEYEEIHTALKNAGYIIYPGKGPLEDKVIHVANVGTLNKQDVDDFCQEISRIIRNKPLIY
jgi:2-aminoethylphosphonate-pyruvate transaminase